jgi:two-component sensor histidine kinase
MDAILRNYHRRRGAAMTPERSKVTETNPQDRVSVPITLVEAAESGRSISALLILLGIGVVVPVLLFSAFLIYRFGVAEHERYELRVSIAAREARSAVDRELKGRLDALQTLAVSTLIARESLPEFYQQAEQEAETWDSNVIVFDAASHKQVLSTRVPYGTQLPDQLDSNVVNVIETGKPIISGLLINRFARHHSFAVYVPVTRAGTVTAVLAGVFDPLRVSEVLRDDVQSAELVASTTDRSGVIIARSKDHERFVGSPVPSALFERASNSELTIARARNLDGALALIGLARSRITGWVVAVSVPVDIIEAPLSHSWLTFGIAGVSLFALSAVIALLVGRYLTRPVLSLVQAAVRLGRGEVVLSTASGVREINVVFRALSRASIERRRAEEHADFLMRELAHRSKNLLAIVQAIARQSARYASHFNEFQSAFSARIGALAHSIDLLASRQWVGTDPASLVHSQLAPFSEVEGSRIKTEGPRIILKPDAAEALGLALHELATNALKYGSLSVPQGFVTVKWQQDSAHFSMVWSEHNGPPVVAPSSKGFGRVVIEQMVARSLSASVSLEFAREGVRWAIEMPTSIVAAAPSELS